MISRRWTISSQRALQRLGKPEEMAELVAWLAGDAASFEDRAYYNPRPESVVEPPGNRRRRRHAAPAGQPVDLHDRELEWRPNDLAVR